jgi:hypothetical protein
MMKMFVVVVQGVYRHGILGVFDDYSLAVKVAQDAAYEEKDGYHDFEVLSGTLNQAVDDMDVAYSCKWQVERFLEDEQKRILGWKKIKLLEEKMNDN